MSGGIQKGSTCYDHMSLSLDQQVNRISKQLSHTLGYKVLRKLPQDMIPGNIGSCAPDGGIWFRDSIPVLVFEAKKQNNAGNAIERWYKNNYILRTINPSISYVTLCSGPGATDGGCIQRILNISHLDGFNKFHICKNSCFLKETGFSDEEIKKIMSLCIKAVYETSI